MIYFYYNFFDRANEANIYEIKSRWLRSLQVVIVEEKLDGFVIDDIETLQDLLGVVFIDKECGNLRVATDDGELTRNNNQKKKSDLLQAYRCPLSKKCYRWDYFFNRCVLWIN